MGKKGIAVFFIFCFGYCLSWAGVRPQVICLGDSLTSGYGLSPDEAYPYLVELKLKAQGVDVQMINAGISGSTTASGKGRLEWLIKGHGIPKVLLLALGANDGLRGQDLAKSKNNLANIIEFAQSKNISVLLAGLKIPKNYGLPYSQEFENMFVDLAETYKLPLIPFFLEGVALNPQFNLPDGLHPNAKGQEIIADTVTKYLLPLVSERP
jgi:acyl-CoA thioesterase I